MATERRAPLIVVGSARVGAAEEIVARLRRTGAVAYAVHSADGCLRVATAVGPDVVLLDPGWSSRLVKMLRSHPRTRDAQVLHTDDATRLRPAAPAVRPRAVPV